MIVETGQIVALITFVTFILLASIVGIRMWRQRQPVLAVACGGVAGFVFLLGLWFLISVD